jgi:DNA-binding Lrp family transcriptional regulator
MEEINEFIKENPKMELKKIAKMYGISVSAVSKRRAFLGIKHGTAVICKEIETLLHLKNIDIAYKLGCTQSLVGVVRHKQVKKSKTKRVYLDDEQNKIVIENYDKMSIAKLAEKVGVTAHVLRNRMLEMELYNDGNSKLHRYDYDLDDGNGNFDLEKYKKIML